MHNIAAFGYSLTGLFFLVLCFLLAINWQKKLQGGFLLAASFVTAIWAFLIAWQLAFGGLLSQLIWGIETLRSLSWLMFFSFLLWELLSRNNLSKNWLFVLAGLYTAITIFQIIPHEYLLSVLLNLDMPFINDLRIVLFLTLAIIGISLVEQFFRNTSPESRWTIKYLCLGLGLGFFYDFFLYADALLYQRIDPLIWESRGAVNAIVAPLVAVSARRNPDWSLKVFVSKQVVFHSTGILVAGTYLLSMALIGYYIKDFGGEYGDFFRLVFFVVAIVLLFMLVASGQLRAKLKVFLNKNFFKYQYDYREEWLKLIKILSDIDNRMPLPDRVVAVMSQIMDSHQANLWRCSKGGCKCVAGADKLEFRVTSEEWNSAIAFMSDTHWIINIDEFKINPDIYNNLELPDAVLQHHDAWLIVPLIHEDMLHSFVVLSHSNSINKFNWENRDLLMMAGRQSASYMVLEEAAGALAEARQFEGFNRLSAFVIHDLKNLIAQLSLVTRNATRHRHNPAFIDDAMTTIENSVAKMNRLMLQLKSAGMSDKRVTVDIVAMVEDVILEKQHQKPVPVLESRLSEDIYLEAESERLSAIIGHIIQNAQDATPDQGQIKVILENDSSTLRIRVIDTGSGMDEEFIRNRLFTPFDTTKGLTGMGIGAYECKEFIQTMNGEIEVISELGKGTEFIVKIPVDNNNANRGEDIGQF